MARARNMKTPAVVQPDAAEIAAIEAALAAASDEIELPDDPVEEVENEIEALYADQETDDVHVDVIESTEEVDEEAAVVALYKEQDTGEEAEVPEAAKIRTKRVKSVKIGTKTGPAIPKDFAPAVKTLLGPSPVLDLSAGALEEEEVDALIAKVTQKKVREKVVNTLHAARNGGRGLSVYTGIALKLLREASAKGDSISGADIKAAFKAEGYSEGTANAQSGQQVALLPVLHIVNKSGPRMALNTNSVVADLLRGVDADTGTEINVA